MEDDENLARLGRRISQLRHAKNLSQEALAELSGLHRNYIGGIERGERNVGITALFNVARGLGISMKDLFAEF